MNRYFDKKQNFNSNSRIYQAFYADTERVTRRAPKWLEALTARLEKAAADGTLTRALRIAKAVTFSLVLVAFLGVVGAIEYGKLGLGAGLMISSILLGIEYLCLRRHRA